jgi:hypothetical protein
MPLGFEAAIHLGNAHNLVAALHHQPGRIRSHVAKSLNHHPAAVNRHVQVAQALVANHQHAAPGGLNASARPADVQRLARHHAGHRMPMCIE